MTWNFQKWYELPTNFPDDGQEVWTRLDRFVGTPFKSIFDSSTQEFTSVENGLIIPAYMVARFRPIFKNNLLLDAYPSIVGCFSFRKLLTDFDRGPFTVWRAASSTSLEIDFDNDYIDAQQIISFSNNTILRISSLANQKDTINPAINATNTQRPTIYSGSSFVSLKGKIYADWGNNKLISPRLLASNQYTIIAVISPRYLNSTRNICSQWSSAAVPDRAKLLHQISGKLGSFSCLATCNDNRSTFSLSANPSILSIRVNGTSRTFGQNGIEENTIQSNDVTLGNFAFVLGGLDNTSEYMNAYFAELLVFNTDLGASIDAIINDCKSFYDIQ